MNDVLTCAIIGHIVGDYLVQTDWMALNKKKPGIEGFFACLVHACIWTMCVMWFAGWGRPFHFAESIAFLPLALPHFIQDRTNIVLWWMKLRWKDQAAFATGPCSPWSIIVVDNVWHIVTIWAVWKYIA